MAAVAARDQDLTLRPAHGDRAPGHEDRHHPVADGAQFGSERIGRDQDGEGDDPDGRIPGRLAPAPAKATRRPEPRSVVQRPV